MAGALSRKGATVEDRFRKLPDEQLVLLTQYGHFPQARDLLIQRHFEWVAKRVNWLSTTYALKEQDREDANQEALFWLIEAIAGFKTRRQSTSLNCKFRSFLYRVVTSRFKDYLRRLERMDRYKKHLRQSLLGSEFGQRHFAAYLVRCCAHHETESETVALAQNREILSHLRLLLKQQAPCDREMVEQLWAGVSLREIALNQHISYEVAKRRRRKLLRHLKHCLSN